MTPVDAVFAALEVLGPVAWGAAVGLLVGYATGRGRANSAELDAERDAWAVDRAELEAEVDRLSRSRMQGPRRPAVQRRLEMADRARRSRLFDQDLNAPNGPDASNASVGRALRAVPSARPCSVVPLRSQVDQRAFDDLLARIDRLAGEDPVVRSGAAAPPPA